MSLYADDVVVFSHSSPDDLAAVKGIVEIFRQASGVRTNYAKCSTMLIHCTNDIADMVVATISCPTVHFAVTYLDRVLHL